jgi:hypothetical protein
MVERMADDFGRNRSTARLDEIVKAPRFIISTATAFVALAGMTTRGCSD